MLSNTTSDLSMLVEVKNETSDNSESQKKGPRKMYLAALASLTFPIALGMAASYSATATEDMKKAGSRVKPNDNEISWIGSLVAIGALFGGLATGFLCNIYGRKGALIISTIPFVSGWLFIAYASSVGYIYVGRILTGFCASLICVVVPSYTVEISTPDSRGLLGACFQVAATMGTLLITVFGKYMSWNWQAVGGAIMVTLALMCICCVPESPRWLVSKGRFDEAMKALEFLYGPHFDAAAECVAINTDIRQQPKGKIKLKELLEPFVYKPTLFSMGLLFFQQTCGSNAVLFYTETIFKGAGSTLSAIDATIIVDIVLVLVTVVSSAVIDKVGRKVLLLISGCGMGISLCVLGGYEYLRQAHPLAVAHYAWIPLACVLIYISSLSTGFGPVPWLMMAEMSPIRYRAFIGGATAVCCWAFVFIVTKTFSDLTNTINDYGAYWLYAFFSFLSCLFTLLLPETKGKTFEEIQHTFIATK